MGAFGDGASVVCWYLMNLQGYVQRSIGSAWMIGFENAGGIVATFAFLKQDAPYYRTMTMGIVGTVATLLYAALGQKEKRDARRAGDEKAKIMSM